MLCSPPAGRYRMPSFRLGRTSGTTFLNLRSTGGRTQPISSHTDGIPRLSRPRLRFILRFCSLTDSGTGRQRGPIEAPEFPTTTILPSLWTTVAAIEADSENAIVTLPPEPNLDGKPYPSRPAFQNWRNIAV